MELCGNKSTKKNLELNLKGLSFNTMPMKYGGEICFLFLVAVSTLAAVFWII